MVSILVPGRFDPIHNGHIDIVLRAAELFSAVIVEVYPDGEKPWATTVLRSDSTF